MDLKAAGLDHNEPRFEFHMMILNDQGFIKLEDGDAGIGLDKSRTVLRRGRFCR